MGEDIAIGGTDTADDAPTGDEVGESSVVMKDVPDGGDGPDGGSTGVSVEEGVSFNQEATAGAGTGAPFTLVGTTDAPPVGQKSHHALFVQDVVVPICQGEGPSRGPASPPSIAGSSWALGPVLGLSSTGEGPVGVPFGELLREVHRVIGQLGAGLTSGTLNFFVQISYFDFQ